MIILILRFQLYTNRAKPRRGFTSKKRGHYRSNVPAFVVSDAIVLSCDNVNLHPFQSPKLNKNPLPLMRKADNLRMFKRLSEDLTEISIEINLRWVASRVVIGFNICDGGERVDRCTMAFRHLLTDSGIVLHSVDHRIPLVGAESVVDTTKTLGHLCATSRLDCIER